MSSEIPMPDTIEIPESLIRAMLNTDPSKSWGLPQVALYLRKMDQIGMARRLESYVDTLTKAYHDLYGEPEFRENPAGYFEDGSD